jgi:hypothetical protein
MPDLGCRCVVVGLPIYLIMRYALGYFYILLDRCHSPGVPFKVDDIVLWLFGFPTFRRTREREEAHRIR